MQLSSRIKALETVTKPQRVVVVSDNRPYTTAQEAHAAYPGEDLLIIKVIRDRNPSEALHA